MPLIIINVLVLTYIINILLTLICNTWEEMLSLEKIKRSKGSYTLKVSLLLILAD